MALNPAGTDFLEARRNLCDGHDDPDVELLEVEITVVRTHGSPHMHLVEDACVTCPTCGEDFYDTDVTDKMEQLSRELAAARAMLRALRGGEG